MSRSRLGESYNLWRMEKAVTQAGTEERLYGLISDLYPICRSITGDGLRKSLQILKEQIPLEIREVPTGTQVFDWTIPKEWNIRDAWIKDSNGQKIIDFENSNLHVLNYSIPVDKTVTLDQLKKHSYALPDQPDLIPYRTSYYNEQWGFCMTHNQLRSMKDDEYQVYIDSSLEDGSMTYGEFLVEGDTADEVLVSCHSCHPSLANDNLSGVAVAVELAKSLMQKELRYSYRFLFIPGTIGSIAWLALNEENISNIKHGLVLACVGDSGPITYKKSRQGDAEIDRIMKRVLTDEGVNHEVREFSPYGYDERQFCSPAFDLPVGCFMRTPFGEFPEYHTSADNLDFVKPAALADSLSKLKKVVHIIESNATYRNLNPKGEPNLGKRGLYKLTGGNNQVEIDHLAILWVLNLSDGKHSLLDIAERANLDFYKIKRAADALLKVELLKRVS